MNLEQLLRLSPTKLAMYLTCPRRFAFRYVENLKIAPSAAMKLSGVGHSVIEHNYRQKVKSRKDLLLDDIADLYRTNWRSELEKEEVIFDRKDGETPDGICDQGILAVKAHHRIIAPTVMPLQEAAIEEPFDVPLISKDEVDPDKKTRYSLIGKIDITDEAHVIRDNKIVGKLPSSIEVAKSPQLSVYAIAKRIQTQEPEGGLALDVVVKSKDPKAVTIPAKRTREFLVEQLNTIGHVARAIEAHAFPRNTDGWHCSEKFCGYWWRCVGKNLTTVDLAPATPNDQIEQALKESVDARSN